MRRSADKYASMYSSHREMCFHTCSYSRRRCSYGHWSHERLAAPSGTARKVRHHSLFIYSSIITPCSALLEINNLIKRQTKLSFIKRYLDKDDIATEISNCNNMLHDCLSQFNVCYIDSSLRARLNDIQISIGVRVLRYARNPTQLDPIDDDIPLTGLPGASDPLESLRILHDQENERDRSHDNTDLQRILSKALETENDAETMRLLQLEKFDMVETIKTLLRALEQVQGTAAVSDVRKYKTQHRRKSSTWPSDRFEAKDIDLRHQEFIDRGMESVRQEWKGQQPELENWTITK